MRHDLRHQNLFFDIGNDQQPDVASLLPGIQVQFGHAENYCLVTCCVPTLKPTLRALLLREIRRRRTQRDRDRPAWAKTPGAGGRGRS